MEVESIFTEGRWNIISELAHSPKSPSQLAKNTKTSLANISIQMRLLEALDFVEQEKQTDPLSSARKIYSLKKPICYLTLASRFAIGKRMIPVTDESMAFFTAWLIKEENAPQLVIKVLSNHDDLMSSDSICYISLKNDILELLAVSREKTEFCDFTVRCQDKTCSVKIHSFSRTEFSDRFSNKEDFVISLVRKALVLKDYDKYLTDLKRGGK